MKLKEILKRRRNGEFTAIYECENCKNTHQEWGMDEPYFFEKVLPDTRCLKCDYCTLDGVKEEVKK